MSDLVPAGTAPPTGGSVLTPLRDPAAGPFPARLKTFAAQPAVRKALPWFAVMAGMGVLALTWSTLAPAPQRVLYSSLNDSERAEVAAALDTGGIAYSIDNGTGALTVGEDDLYRARMLVASDGALAAPESGTDLLNSLPMGASRTLEGDRLRSAQERELTLTIGEIDGVEAVRVHLAKADRSVFVRDDVPPSASVMVRMARGRQLSESQVIAIANLVAGSVPGLAIDSVRIVDQHGRLLSQDDGSKSDRLDLQSRLETKLRTQVDQLLAPMIGAGNFSSEIQVELDMDEVTSARESYDKDGVIRRETVQESQRGANTAAGGVPGVLSNTPPAQPEAVEGAPQGGPAAGGATQANGESSATRTYEVGREVAVSNSAPGSIRRLSVAVALNADAMEKADVAELNKIEELVAAAVGADEERGDKVAVMVRAFQPLEVEETNFWETAWFATILRNVVALLGVLLVLLLAVRPALKSLSRGQTPPGDDEASEEDGATPARADSETRKAPPAPEELSTQIELAQRIVQEKPTDALLALRKMLNESPARPEAAQ